MNKLIRAGIKRMFRIKTLYICLAVLFFIDGFDIIKEYLFREAGRSLPDPDGYLLSGFLTMVLLSAILITSFLGAEHQFGTLRNKIATGSTKTEIYISSFIVCLTAVMIMYVFVWLMTTVLGTVFLGGYTNSKRGLIILLAVSLIGFIVLTALFVLMGLCIQSKSLGSVTAVTAAFLIMICGVMTVQVLSVPQYLTIDSIPAQEQYRYESVADDPSLVINPDYVGGSSRKVFEAIHALCPVSQIIAASEETDAKTVLVFVAETVVLAAGGVIIFKRRDLK